MGFRFPIRFHCPPSAAQELTPLSGADPEESAMFFNALNERKILGKIAMGKRAPAAALRT